MRSHSLKHYDYFIFFCITLLKQMESQRYKFCTVFTATYFQYFMIIMIFFRPHWLVSGRHGTYKILNENDKINFSIQNRQLPIKVCIIIFISNISNITIMIFKFSLPMVLSKLETCKKVWTFFKLDYLRWNWLLHRTQTTYSPN